MSLQLIEREHRDGAAVSRAVYSPCEGYRYLLTRDWGGGKRLLYIMLNPSKATELANDPTIERCERRARALGYCAVGIVNLFGWRETSPSLLRKAANPVGADNASVIADALDWTDDVLAAWGVHGDLMDQAAAMAGTLAAQTAPVFCLGTTKAGHPRHPLYVAYATPLVPWPQKRLHIGAESS